MCLNARNATSCSTDVTTPAKMSIMDHNGGSVVAMVGKECIAIACDLRLGTQALGVASDFEKVRWLSVC
jgi:20S proteasome alpha/beta subunit